MIVTMVRGNPNWGKQNPTTWCFRVRGKSPDDEMVTLGIYESEREAKARHVELVKEGYYRLLRVQPLKPKPAEPEE